MARQPLPVYDSMQACASATGIPLDKIKAAKRAGLACFRSNKVTVNKELLRYVTNGHDRPDWGEEGRKWEAESRRIKVEKAQDRFWEKSEVEQAIDGAVSIFFKEIDHLFNVEFPTQLRGLDAAELQRRLAAGAERCKQSLKTGLKQFANL